MTIVTGISTIFVDFSDRLGKHAENFGFVLRDSFYSKLRGYKIYFASGVFWNPWLPPKNGQKVQWTTRQGRNLRIMLHVLLSKLRVENDARNGNFKNNS